MKKIMQLKSNHILQPWWRKGCHQTKPASVVSSYDDIWWHMVTYGDATQPRSISQRTWTQCQCRGQYTRPAEYLHKINKVSRIAVCMWKPLHLPTIGSFRVFFSESEKAERRCTLHSSRLCAVLQPATCFMFCAHTRIMHTKWMILEVSEQQAAVVHKLYWRDTVLIFHKLGLKFYKRFWKIIPPLFGYPKKKNLRSEPSLPLGNSTAGTIATTIHGQELHLTPWHMCSAPRSWMGFSGGRRLHRRNRRVDALSSLASEKKTRRDAKNVSCMMEFQLSYHQHSNTQPCR